MHGPQVVDHTLTIVSLLEYKKLLSYVPWLPFIALAEKFGISGLGVDTGAGVGVGLGVAVGAGVGLGVGVAVGVGLGVGVAAEGVLVTEGVGC